MGQVAGGADAANASGALGSLAAVVAAKPAGQTRAGQEAMCQAVETALASGEHLLVEAPTGVGKSLAYLVPAVARAVAGDTPVIVVTATKALQEQLTRADLPFLASALPGRPFRYAMLKGRSNYLCRAKLEVTLTDGVEARLDFGEAGPEGAHRAVSGLAAWAGRTDSGDRAEAPESVSDAVWSQVSVDPGECPGAARCHAGESCFAEAARSRAAEAQIVVVNAHLYAAHLASEGQVLPPHQAVVFDEAHTVEDVMADALGVRLTPARIRRAGVRLRGAGCDARLAGRLERAGDSLEEVLGVPDEGIRVDPTDDPIAAVLSMVTALAGDGLGALRRLSPGDEVARAKVSQAIRLVEGLADDVARLLDADAYDNQVAWVEANRGRPELHLAVIDVGPILAARLYPRVTVIATSATLATGGRFEGLARRLGLTLAPPPTNGETGQEGPGAPEPRPPGHRALAVDSPFDHARQGFLYVARHLPDPNDPAFPKAMLAELHTLIVAAAGRTLALFTSRAAMERAALALCGAGPYEVLVQDRLPRPELLARFRSGPGNALLATQSFWQGVDLPGGLCNLVTIDRIPFPRPTDPLVQARRRAATARRENDFAAVDLPAAAILLAQGAGRLIRTTTDHGVVAVFDRRLATRPYRHTLLATMPPLRRTLDQAQVVRVLTELSKRAG